MLLFDLQDCLYKLDGKPARLAASSDAAAVVVVPYSHRSKGGPVARVEKAFGSVLFLLGSCCPSFSWSSSEAAGAKKIDPSPITLPSLVPTLTLELGFLLS